MKSLSQIRRDIVSFYSTVQKKVTDFSTGSVVSGIFYSVSASLENIYSEIDEVRRQAYVATATGEYLDRLIDGTFQLERTPATRSTGYVTIFADSPLTDAIQLRYAELDSDGNFSGGVTASTKFIGYPNEGEEGIVFTLIRPENAGANVDLVERTITLPAGTQYAIFPVASVLTGTRVRVGEGDIYSYPNSPTGISGVLNTLNPGQVFFSNEEYTGGAPFASRFTTARSYNESSGNFVVDNAFNFSNRGRIEIRQDTAGREVVATYTENVDGTGQAVDEGIILEYIDSSISTISLKQPVDNANNTLPTVQITAGGVVKSLYLYSYSYNGTTYTNTDTATFIANLSSLLAAPAAPLVVRQRRLELSDELIFDPDSQLTADYKLLNTASVTGATDRATDAEYRQALIKYLEGLGRATNSALVAGSLQVPGVSFAATLPKYLSPNGSAVVVASDADGFLSPDKRREVIDYLLDDWSAAGINLVVRSPERIPVHISINVQKDASSFEANVTQDIIDTTEEYIDRLSPGDTLEYSELLYRYNELPGISNVYNLVITKELTDTTYDTYKAEYDELAIKTLTGANITSDSGGTYVSADVGKIIVSDDSAGQLVAWTASEYDSQFDPVADTYIGVLYTVQGTYSELFTTSEPVLTYNLLNDIVNSQINNVEAFKNVILDYQDEFDGTTEDFYYVLSYLLSETINANILDTYPVNPTLVKSENLQDYEATPVEIYRVGTVTIGQDTRKLIGINYL